MSDVDDAFEELAGRGTPRGFDHVLASAAAAAERGGFSDEVGAERGDGDPIPFVTTEPVARRPLGSMIAAAGVAALVLVGAFAVGALVGSGGSSSPEGAVRRLADALSHEDPLAAADVLAPEEVRSLHGTLENAAGRAQELELVQAAGAPLAGVDFDVAGLKLSTQTLGDGYVKVTIETGTFAASTHKAQFSPVMQKVLRDTDDNHAQTDLAQLAASHDLPTFVVAVRRDGNWYVSAAYTVLEYVREANQLPAADFGSGTRSIASLGADSPDAAVQGAMHALQQGDWSKLMTLAPPDEIPVYDYRDALTALIRRDGSNGSGPRFTIDSMTTDAQVAGDTAKVLLTASGTTDSGTWKLAGGCFTPPSSRDASFTGLACGTSGGFPTLLLPIETADSTSRITAVERNGRWFVSPVGTVLDVVDRFVAQIDRRSLYSMLAIPNQLPPDGTLTLGTPFELNAANQGLLVLTFAGHKGERLLGTSSVLGTPSAAAAIDYGDPYVEARVFAPDGTEIDTASGVLRGEPVELPADGTYKLTFHSYVVRGRGAKVTVWDEDKAPASVRSGPGNGGVSHCTYVIGSSSCESFGSSSASGILVVPSASPTSVGNSNSSSKTSSVPGG